MFVGPLFTREAAVAPRRQQLYLVRVMYGMALIILVATAWMVMNGTQTVRNLSDMARFGGTLLQVLAPLQLVLLLFMAATQSASRVSIEKDRQTLILLLMTRMNNTELVVGKMLSSLLIAGSMLLTALPIFMLLVLFGGSSFAQVGWTFAVTAMACLVASSLGTLVGYWREKTFQALALTLLLMLAWAGAGELIAASEWSLGKYDAAMLAGSLSPVRAVFAACRPDVMQRLSSDLIPYFVVQTGLVTLLLGFAILMVRRWNPSRDIRAPQPEMSTDQQNAVETSPSQSTRAVPGDKYRKVWDNPILWREMRTWAYGKKILFIRFAWWALAIALGSVLWWQVTSGIAIRTTSSAAVTVPEIAKPLGPLLIISLVVLNALAVTSITSERDGRSLDLLQMTDLTPGEFLYGKLLGVLYVGLDVILVPLLIFASLWYSSVISGENLVFLILGTMILFVFVAVLGIHCGIVYGSSRHSIGVSLGTVFFLFLGIITVMLMMVSFTGNVEAQLAPFLAAIVGGAVGLYVALGRNTPSPALVAACCVLPLSMFYCITNLLLKNYGLVMIVLAGAYGFTIVALMVPKLRELHFESGIRQRDEDDG